jgi:hypothetical protein
MIKASKARKPKALKAMSANEFKTFENRLRRAAERRGLFLSRSRTRDPKGIDYNRYALLDMVNGGAVNPAIADRWQHSWTLKQVCDYLG